MMNHRHLKIWILGLLVLIGCMLRAVPVQAADTYTINDREFKAADWEAQEFSGAKEAAEAIYQSIWDVVPEDSFEGNEDTGRNLLRRLSGDDLKISAENAETYVKSARPGALIRLTVRPGDRLNEAGELPSGKEQRIVIAAIYDEGFVGVTFSKKIRCGFMKWGEFADRYADALYYDYIKWPDAPALALDHEENDGAAASTEPLSWRGFLLTALGGILVSIGAMLVAGVGAKRKASGQNSVRFRQVLMGALPMIWGLYYLWSAVLLTLILFLCLVRLQTERGYLKLRLDRGLLIAAALFVGYSISCLTAVDRGMAVFGIVKVLPLLPAALLMQQFEDGERNEILAAIPASGAVMTVLSAGLSFLPGIGQEMTVNGRLAGLFQYPNTYALYLLAGLVILFRSADSTGKKKPVRLVLAGILLAGLIASGSRTVFVLSLLVFGIRILQMGSRRQRVILTGAGCAALAILLILGRLLPDSVLGRYLLITLDSSTLQGRLLYWQDAIPVILHHPLGLGYRGYYSLQGSFQTGVYSVLYAHNGWIQFLLDVGWLPTLVAALGFVGGMIRTKDKTCRLVLLAVLLHSFMDFSLEFGAIWLICLLALPVDSLTKERSWKRVWVTAAMGILCCAFSMPMGIASYIENEGRAAQTLAVYPLDTTAMELSLTTAENAEDMEWWADRILALNPSSSLAHSAKARVAFSRGDVAEMMGEAELAMAGNRYSGEVYRDYVEMLSQVYPIFLEQGYEEDAAYCRQVMLSIPERMQEVLEQTSPAGWKIVDQPNLTLTEEQEAFLRQLQR